MIIGTSKCKWSCVPGLLRSGPSWQCAGNDALLEGGPLLVPREAARTKDNAIRVQKDHVRMTAYVPLLEAA